MIVSRSLALEPEVLSVHTRRLATQPQHQETQPHPTKTNQKSISAVLGYPLNKPEAHLDTYQQEITILEEDPSYNLQALRKVDSLKII